MIPPTKFRHFSDMHGWNPDFKRDTDMHEVCIVAGDHDNYGKNGNRLYLLLEELCFRFKEVIFVPGNHEYYGTNIPTLVSKIRKKMDHVDNFTLLQGGEYIDKYGVRIIGATLWSDVRPIRNIIEESMNDYRYIRTGPTGSPWQRTINPSDIYALHVAHVKAINEALLSWDGDSIVVSHHAPSTISIDPKYKDSKINAAYATDIKLDKWPNYWIHGHIHREQSYLLNGCNIRCNPGGYAAEYTGFEPLTNYFYL